MNSFVADPALASNGSMLVNQIEVDQEPLPTNDKSLIEVALSNMEGKHETARITTKLEATEVETMQDKTVAFNYGPRGNLGTFYGYVNKVAASKAYQEDGTYDIDCFGTTSPLQGGTPKFFENRTAPQMVSELVSASGIGVQVDDHNFVWPTYAKTDQTDWAFINELASVLGWAVYNFNGVVRLVNPLRILNETGPVLRLIRGAEALDRTRQLLDFMPASESINVASLVKPVFGFFDNDKVTLSHPIDRQHRLYTDSPTLNRSMANLASAAWEANPTRWTHTAQGRIQGNASVVPGTVVDIQSSGSSVIQHDYDGLWLVRGVQHVLTSKSFQTLLTLARDDEERKGNIEYRPFWAISNSGRPQVVRKGDVWESSWKQPSVVSSSLTPAKSTTSNHVWKVS